MERADDLYERASRVLPGGVTAAARTNAALGRPFYVSRAAGPYVFDEEGRCYVDTCTSNGAALLGHAHPAVVRAVEQAVALGMASAYDGEAQVRLAERLVATIPAYEQVRFTTTGTEATFYCVRIARAYTGRSLIAKFEGHFHGFNDPLAFNMWAASGTDDAAELPRVRAETAGLPVEAHEQVVVLPFNDTAAFLRTVDRFGNQLAAVILEPINYDAGAIMPDRAFLQRVRDETARRGIVLIFDEILSGFRTGPDGAQGYLGVTPDLSTLGKALGGGVPLSAFGGRRELMGVVSPLGPAAHTGTYNAHPIPIMAADAFLDVIAEPGFYPHLLGLSERWHTGMQRAFDEAGLPVRVQGVGARCGMFFGLDPDVEVVSCRQAARHDKELQHAFCREMHRRGVYVNPAWHHGVSAMHTDELVDFVTEQAAHSARAIARHTAPLMAPL